MKVYTDFSMAKYKEDLDLVAMNPIKGFKQDEYTYVLGDKQKQMIIDAVEQKPYDTLKYYFSNSRNLATDGELMNSWFDDIWKIQALRGYQNLRIETPEGIFGNHIVDADLLDRIVKSIDDVNEELDLVPMSNDTNILAQAIADKIGSCQVDGNTIYQLMDYFEIYDEDNDDFIEIPFGIFAIYEIKDGKIIWWNTDPQVCEEIDSIGKKPIDYFKSTKVYEAISLSDFILEMDDFFGREWFGTSEEEQEFVETYGDLL